MTPTPRGGGLRSMGASLLDDVLAETLDPAYAQAAQRRAAGEPRETRTRRGRVLVAGVLAVSGLLAAVTYNVAAESSEGRQGIRQALVEDIRRGSDEGDELAASSAALSEDIGRTRDALLAASVVGQRALDTLDAAERAAAAVPVTGPGLRITLANAGSNADADPVGGTTQEDPRGRVRDGDLQVVVNALWAGGAEAISINGQRLGPTSAIRFAGEAVLVDFRPVTNPYEIRAIGNPDALSVGFLASPEVVALGVISAAFGLQFDYAPEQELTLPAALTPELRYARPPSALAAEEPESTEPADPEPGGGP